MPFRGRIHCSIGSDRSFAEIRQELLSVGPYAPSIQVFDFGYTIGIGQNVIPSSGLCLGPLMYCPCEPRASGGSIIIAKWRLPGFMLVSVLGFVAAALLLVISLVTGLDASLQMIGGPELSSNPVQDVALKTMLISIAVNVLGRSLPQGHVMDYLHAKIPASHVGQK